MRTSGRRRWWGSRRARAVGLVGVVAAVTLGGVAVAGRPLRTVAIGAVPVPIEDPTRRCVDLLDAHVCWASASSGAACAATPCVSARITPQGPAPSGGWRCEGIGPDRACYSRRHDASPFVCDAKGACIQHEPRLPDDGEWECIEVEGVVQCHGTARAAGVSEGPRDVGWLCGTRAAGHRNDDAGATAPRVPIPAPPETVCVDFSPDRPEGSALGWQCLLQWFPYASVAAQVCSHPKVTAPAIGDACEGACPKDARCIAGRCVPPAPDITCWLDTDCGPGEHCRWGTCEASK